MSEEELLKILNKEKNYTEEDLLLFIYNLRKEIKQLQQENQQLKEAIKRCYTPEEVDFEIMPVKAELEAGKDINNNLHKTIDKLRVNLYEKEQENSQLKERIEKAIEYVESNSYFKDNAVKTMIFKDYSNELLEILKGDKE